MLRARQRSAIPFLLSVLLALTACGSDAPDAAAPPGAGGNPSPAADDRSADPCALVTAAEAAQALGAADVTTERPAAANILPALATCQYQAESERSLEVLTVQLRRGYSESEARSGFGMLQSTYEGSGWESVSGLGEQAAWLAELEQLWVLSGRYQLGISGDIPRERAVALAETALQRLE